jgi:hypothetical protein
MIKVPFIKSRNFKSYDICRSADTVTETGLYLTGYVHGHAQGLRDSLYKKYPERFKGLVLTSTNRGAYNTDIKNAAKGSHHVWRVESNGNLHVAYDCYGVGITLQELYDHAVATCRGEIYMNKPEGIVHIAPVPMEDEHWIQ